MGFTFRSFSDWREFSTQKNAPLYRAVLDYEQDQKGNDETTVRQGLAHAYGVMKDAVHTGMHEKMESRSGMVQGGAQKVFGATTTVLTPEFQKLVARALAAKEVNSCMGRVVAAPTAGASGILPGVLVTLQEIHGLEDETIHECLLISAGIGLIIEQRASLAGAVGGCQAETGSAAAMAAGAIVYALADR